MNKKRSSRRVGSHPGSQAKRSQRNGAVKKVAARVGRKAAVTDRARQKVRRRNR